MVRSSGVEAVEGASATMLDQQQQWYEVQEQQRRKHLLLCWTSSNSAKILRSPGGEGRGCLVRGTATVLLKFRSSSIGSVCFNVRPTATGLRSSGTAAENPCAQRGSLLLF